jgi:hypothetical protein
MSYNSRGNTAAMIVAVASIAAVAVQQQEFQYGSIIDSSGQ